MTYNTPHMPQTTGKPHRILCGLPLLLLLFMLIVSSATFAQSTPTRTNVQIKIGGSVYGGGDQGKVLANDAVAGTGNTTVTIKGHITETAAEVTDASVLIGGNVYGGGSEGDVEGNTTVHVQGGDMNAVFGGARMADVGGRTFVNIDGENATSYIVSNFVYGGNDISGNIGNSTVPAEITKDAENGVDESWNAFIRMSAKLESKAVYFTQDEIDTAQPGDAAYEQTVKDVKTPAVPAADNKPIYIGQLYGGGNGDYEYSSTSETTTVNDDPVTVTTYTIRDRQGNQVAQNTTGFTPPEVKKTYLEVLGGSIVYAYGGGNNATVRQETVICVDNPSAVVNSITDGAGNEILTHERFEKMGLNTGFSYPSADAFQIGRFFGGNNRAEMPIRPKWNLLSGKIREVFSGGNRGDMASPDGLFLYIPEWSTIKVDNLYGGCRMANVHPKDERGDDVVVPVLTLEGVTFPRNMAGRVLINGGDVNNIYGGNDITGKVWGGTVIHLNTSIRGDLYGGGNGSYPYTDNPALKNDLVYGDFYYEVPDGMSSVEALNLFRPNAEQVSIHLGGGSEYEPTVVGKCLYLGGNCATLIGKEGEPNPTLDLTIGSYAIVDNLFLGNNGENMVKAHEGAATYAGVLYTYTRTLGNLPFLKDTPGYEYKYSNHAASGSKFNTMTLTDESTFKSYMDGIAMRMRPTVQFENDYEEYSSIFGSFFCGGNVASFITEGPTNINFNHHVVVTDKLVGGCNDAYVAANPGFNAEYRGGVLNPTTMPETSTDPIADKLILNLEGLEIVPKRWMVKRDAAYDSIYSHRNPFTGAIVESTSRFETFENSGVSQTVEGEPIYLFDQYGRYQLEWNTIDVRTGKEIPAPTDLPATGLTAEDDLYRRLVGGNIYGGCYNSGHIDGNVVINLNGTIVDRWAVFDKVAIDQEIGEPKLYYVGEHLSSYMIEERHSGVILDEQGMDVLGSALNVFGGGYGVQSEVWGSTTINLRKGFTFQIFGGSEKGAIGRGKIVSDGYQAQAGEYVVNNRAYKYDPRYSTTVNLCGNIPGVPRNSEGDSPDMAGIEFIYGGGFLGPVAGNTQINIGNGRIFNTFAGACNADILGHTETYVGRQLQADGTYVDGGGFPWIRDHIYGGNDLGGRILGEADFSHRVAPETLPKVYNPTNKTLSGTSTPDPDVLKASAYTEYQLGHVENIFGGCYGTYDYTDPEYKEFFYTTGSAGQTNANLGTPREGYYKPYLKNAFVQIKPTHVNSQNEIDMVFGAGQGITGEPEMNNMQDRSYVLVDIPQNMIRFLATEVFGSGAYGGVGMGVDKGVAATNTSGVEAAAIVDLVQGQIASAYGGSFNEGVTRRTVVNVPEGSTISMRNVFGGAYGLSNENPCDVYESWVRFRSPNAKITGGLYGGNNQARRTLYTRVDVDAKVWSDPDQGYTGYVYGGGFGADTWAQYTEVNMNANSYAYKVYGGGSAGKVLNKQTIDAWKAKIAADVAAWQADPTKPEPAVKKLDLTLGSGYEEDNGSDNSGPNLVTGFDNEYMNTTLGKGSALAADIAAGEVHDRDHIYRKYNTNVHIHKDGYVEGYCYGGGYGADAVVSGFTYIDVLGGTVQRDVYAAGESGPIMNLYGATGFIAATNAYLKSGMVRNLYGGGWRGDVGYHDHSQVLPINDIEGYTNVVVGNMSGMSFSDGIPAVMRNVYGGGEGGSVYGSTSVHMNNGRIGYRFEGADPTVFNESDYVEVLEDEGYPTPNTELENAGNIFGGGYVANSYVDESNVTMWGGVVRSSVYGGGEIGPIGRGTLKSNAAAPQGTLVNGNAKIYVPGAAYVKVYNGHVRKDVYGGGRGFDNWGGDGTKYYNAEQVAQMELAIKGFVFGKTDVQVLGGEIGTLDNVALGYGNVFGGGNTGYVYSGSGKRATSGATGLESSSVEGYYYEFDIDANQFKSSGSPAENTLTEDCRVVVEPWCQVLQYKATADIQVGTDDKGNPKYSFTSGAYISNNQRMRILGDASITAAEKSTFLASIQTLGSSDKVSINGTDYFPGDYVPASDLNTMLNKNADQTRWAVIDVAGVTIHNAVFAGGNISPGSEIFANTNTVYGNVTGTVNDIFHRDLVTIGFEHTGGLYGDGNLTLVDGYRELNITNYGTDYYGWDDNISLEYYNTLTDREKAYFELKYRCIKACLDKDNKTVDIGVVLTETEFTDKFAGTNYINEDGTPKPEYFSTEGFCTIYAGRLLNTIQRADFVGVFGSRMVLQGARDRVPEVVDYTNYTINRVGEVSLNKKVSTAGDNVEHGNYFGIYSIVNRMGALTSDVNFSAERQIDNKDTDTYGADYDPATVTISATSEAISGLTSNPINGVSVSGNTVTLTGATTEEKLIALIELKKRSGVTINTTNATRLEQSYYDWKKVHVAERKRNNGTAHNKVALASGVYLELTTEESTADNKVWGYITGVVELDLINVMKGQGGGYVYAKNVHGLRSETGLTQTIISSYNAGAVTNKSYTYTTEDETLLKMQTSGNFIHPTEQIIDDCFPNMGLYKQPSPSPAHYWYIKGSIYVYDQYISAYTGSANPYRETVNIPLTITAASHGKITLMDVQPSLYAYYFDTTGDNASQWQKLGLPDVYYTQAECDAYNEEHNLQPGNAGYLTTADLKFDGTDNSVLIGNTTYHLNDSITYWDYMKLSDAEKKHFVKSTYIVKDSCKVGNTFYPAGYVMLPDEYGTLKTSAESSRQTIDGVANVPAVIKATVDGNGNPVVVEARDENNQLQPVYEAFNFALRSSNNMSHLKGYALTVDLNNPTVWDKYYSAKNSGSDPDKLLYQENKTTIDGSPTSYAEAPTYTPLQSGVYGQRKYEVGDIIPESVHTTYMAIADKPTDNQAIVTAAYVVTEEISSGDLQLYPGTGVSATDYNNYPADVQLKLKPAFVCTSTLEVSATEYVYVGELVTADRIDELRTLVPSSVDVDTYFENAYICTTAGKYGGDHYASGVRYPAIESWNNINQEDRVDADGNPRFVFNYDGLDVLIDSLYRGNTKFYDSAAGNSEILYAKEQPIDYTATYTGVNTTEHPGPLYKQGGTGARVPADPNGDPLSRVEYETIANEQYHFAPILTEEAGPYYIVQEGFATGDTYYSSGNTLTEEFFNGLTEEQKDKVIMFTPTNIYYTQDECDTYNTANNLNEGDEGSLTTASVKVAGYGPGITYYFCRDNYTIGENDATTATQRSLTGVDQSQVKKFVNGTATGVTFPDSYAYGYEVKKGYIIGANEYTALPNDQHDFVIQGTAPVETSTLYVSRQSDIFDLSRGKVITVIFKYEYEESDESAKHIEQITEQHILNIHVNFESGVPQIGPLDPPAAVLPGTTIGLRQPFVTPGAFDIIGGGWEIYSTQSDADSHKNGKAYYNNTTPMYWYQDGYWVAYYTKTYLGKTYSNAVQFKVANYHDLDKVMGDNLHHLYVDNPNVKRPSKIYIDGRDTSSDESKSKIDLLRDLFDLSLQTPNKVNLTTTNDQNQTVNVLDDQGNPIMIDDPTYRYSGPDGNTWNKEHAALNPHVRGGANLDFILKGDVATKKYTEWTPIGNSTQCFEGTLHGDGYTVSGLDHSLFGHLCGDVYNLGVTGSFTEAGVANEGSGYVENCWVMSTATSGWADGVQAVFGNPTRSPYMPVKAGTVLTQGKTYYTSSSGAGEFVASGQNDIATGTNYYEKKPILQIVNSYYPVGNDYKVTENATHGAAMQKPVKAFFNGEVAYDLNGFYLNKRYNDHLSGVTTNPYNYYKADVFTQDGTHLEVQTDGHYADEENYVPYYVESRYEDGDFIYAGGSIPESANERYDVDRDKYYPIWPDDYIYFGQMLTYGYIDGRDHQPTPSYINKTGGRLRTVGSNRVYRAPAYFQSKQMEVAHFNNNAIFATKEKNGTREGLPRLTAIDFTGHGETTAYQRRRWSDETHYTHIAGGAFYPPLLDDDGLRSFQNADETKNLLVYIPQATANADDAATKTNTAVTNYLIEPEYAETDATYRTVATNMSVLNGHRVVKDGDGYTSPVDHFLVDKQDFNAPITYTFAGSASSGKRMWYQRLPERYADMDKGWEGISLPFSPELVTTQTKGEITHFYRNSAGTWAEGYDTGHEYWLRGFAGNLQQKQENNAPVEGVFTADFNPLTAVSANSKERTNTFLWDYYYKETNYLDKNSDEYQKNYYNETKTYSGYPYADAGTPYIIGFPGVRYYEFDLSGTFVPENTKAPIDVLEQQTITFASKPAVSIAVSDDEMESHKTTVGGTTFMPNYLNKVLTTDSYVLDSDGSAYVKLSDTPATYNTTGTTYATAEDFAAAGTLYTDADGTTVAESWANDATIYYTRTSVKTPSANDQNKVTPSLSAFRPYFSAVTLPSSGGGAPKKREVHAITFNQTNTSFGGEEQENKGADSQNLYIYAKKGKIIVESMRDTATDVRIITDTGALVTTFTIEPGQTIETPVKTSTIYLVNGTKIAVK